MLGGLKFVASLRLLTLGGRRGMCRPAGLIGAMLVSRQADSIRRRLSAASTACRALFLPQQFRQLREVCGHPLRVISKKIEKLDNVV